ncbi:MAG: phosphatase PAP2 family protein [Cellulomonas sp.]|nr:phosphatase PAP2 family protein [Cellulomonas sp.]
MARRAEGTLNVRVLAVALAVAALCAGGVWACWRVFVRSAVGQRLDQLSFIGALHGRTRLWQYAERVLDPVSIGYVAAVLVTTMAIAFLRRRWLMALQVAVLMAGANLSTQILKYAVLDRPSFGWGQAANTLPSGHTTAAASASAALLFVVTPRARPWVAVLGAGYTFATGWSTLIGQWHRPSDVVAAVLVVTAWFALACALMVLAPGATPTVTAALPAVATARGGRRGGAPVLALLVAVGVIGTAVAAAAFGASVGGSGVPGTGGQLLAYGAGVAAIGAASAWGFAVQLALREAVGKARDVPGVRAQDPAGADGRRGSR